MQLAWKDNENVWYGLILGPSDQLIYKENKKDVTGNDESTLQVRQTIGGGTTVTRNLADIKGAQATELWNEFLKASGTITGQ